MRVLFCTLDYPPSAAGGAEQQARLQAEALVRRGHRVEVVCARTPGHRSQMLNGVRVHRLHRIELKYLRTISYLVMLAAFLLLRVGRYALVHVHLANLQADVVVPIARLAGRPTYLKVAAGGPLGEIGRMRVISPITRYFGLRHASAIQAISAEIEEDLLAIGVSRGRIHRIPNGVVIPPRAAAAERRSARATLGGEMSEVVALYAGRMEREKGVADLVGAWASLKRPQARLWLVGRPGVKSPVSLEALPVGVEYRGWSDGIAEYVMAADVFVLPSETEGMSNALLESMAAGLACVSTSVGAAPEMIEDRESGLLIEPRNRAELLSALRELIDSPGLRRHLGACARESVTAAYGIDQVVDRIEAAYSTIVSRA